ncbi:hypothetical protein EDC04DRAFT_2722569, partial [Pisolithus marmoratus]
MCMRCGVASDGKRTTDRVVLSYGRSLPSRSKENSQSATTSHRVDATTTIASHCKHDLHVLSLSNRCSPRRHRHLPWDTYNYCNAPHVNPDHYSLPDEAGARLEFVVVVMRHHKRTPDNLYPSERTLNPTNGWDCSSIIPQSYAGGTAQIFTETSTPLSHPFADRIWA